MPGTLRLCSLLQIFKACCKKLLWAQGLKGLYQEEVRLLSRQTDAGLRVHVESGQVMLGIPCWTPTQGAKERDRL